MSAASVAASKAIGIATDAKIMQVLSEHPRGLLQSEIAALTGFKKDRVNSALRRIGTGVVRGWVRENGGSMAVLSALPVHETSMRERVADDIAARRENEKRKKSIANERAAAKRAGRAVRDISDDWADRLPLARIVPAHLAQPLYPRGPSSVWELAK